MSYRPWSRSGRTWSTGTDSRIRTWSGTPLLRHTRRSRTSEDGPAVLSGRRRPADAGRRGRPVAAERRDRDSRGGELACSDPRDDPGGLVPDRPRLAEPPFELAQLVVAHGVRPR